MWQHLVREARQELLGLREQLLRASLDTELRRFVAHEVVELLVQEVGVLQVPDPQTAAPDLVLVGGTDPATRRTNASVSELFLFPLFREPVIREDELGTVAHVEIRGDFDPELAQHLRLGNEGFGVHDAAIADHRQDAWVQDARRDDVQDEFLLAHDNGMARVVAAAVAHDDLHPLG